ncbi:MAG TPA: hypothetical protein VGU61_18670 [Noviherbaspirillum sp.]|uniref:hypothetical protein n=1 Tax=Noviherbaspirillum sp. TaxID=1926288 RepID=UPI002DDD1C40|nr:hypothetical protein [Noviherbaspirillum sp.]HEV2612293.1 hypothetical protein [Noviherbaspirillum sp.]
MKNWIVAGIAVLVVLVAALVLMPDPRQPGIPGVSAPAPGQGGVPAATDKAGGTGIYPGSQPPTPQAGTGPAAPSVNTPAPWMNNSQASGATVPAGGQEKQKRLAELQALQADILRQTQQGRQPDAKQVDATLAKLQEIEGAPIVAGVNIPAVRSNLDKAQQLQQLAQEMEREARKPGGPDMNKLKAQMAQLQQLQGQLRNDVSVNQPGMPAPVAAPDAGGTKK